MLVKPEVHIACFKAIVRRGKEVLCESCGVIGKTQRSYETEILDIKSSNRLHTRGHARGGHRNK